MQFLHNSMHTCFKTVNKVNFMLTLKASYLNFDFR